MLNNKAISVLCVCFMSVGAVCFWLNSNVEEYCFNILVDDKPAVRFGGVDICMPAGDANIFDDYWAITNDPSPVYGRVFILIMKPLEEMVLVSTLVLLGRSMLTSHL